MDAGVHGRTGPKVSFGGRGLKSIAPIFSPVLAPKMKWFCPNITCFLPENGHLKNYCGVGGLQPPSPPPPPLRTSYVYAAEYGIYGR